MLKNLTIRNRMFIIMGLILILFAFMTWFSNSNSHKVGDLAMDDTRTAMLDGQKAKLQVATHSMALSIGASLESIDGEDAKIEAIRVAVDKIRFEEDKSGYYFVYRGTTCVALPPKKSLQGKDLGHLKSKSGVEFVKGLRDAAKGGGGFVTYDWPKPPGNEEVEKLGFAEMIPGTDFWIGTGVYLDNIDAYTAAMQNSIGGKVKSLTMQMMIIAAVIFAVILVFCFTIITGIT